MLERKINQLIASPQSFDFYQAVRLLKQALPEKEESLTFKVSPGLNFPISDILELNWLEGDENRDKKLQMLVSFSGLVGPHGALPDHFKESILERIDQKDFAFLSFLDLFHDAAIRLFYKIWEEGHYEARYEVSAKDSFSDYSDNLLAILYGLSGNYRSQHADGSTEPTFETAIFYSGLSSLHNRPREALKSMLEDYFDCPITINNFIPEKKPIHSSELTRLSRSFSHNHLGVDAVLGKYIWYSQNHFEIEIGPLAYESYKRFLPNGNVLTAFNSMVEQFVGHEFEFHLSLIIKGDEIPSFTLSRNKKRNLARRLGWDAWLGSREKSAKTTYRVRLYKKSNQILNS